ncbi:MAG: macro domain-containing protein [Candidatus Desulfatibia sp.]|uniref:type II toxin-antitoxin system antitoxin DNA ADP-ribosyl glycohydrolase DarG n=1 Tax=Candidatus Desulfatibia sp. TaxID=3101189 RepID=UPI002F324675
MIEIAKGNLLELDVEALVNTVNCDGFMGKGIALQFKKAFPENNDAYARACRAKEMQVGKMHVFETGLIVNPRFIINFPTKRHWRGPSRLDDIDTGLNALIKEVSKLDIKSIAIPPLGCGLGGLDWRIVRPKIEKAFAKLPEVKIMLFEPVGTPDAKNMPVRTKRPKMTIARALLIKLMQRYAKLAYRLTLLEIQKLAYFLQESGEPLRLKYEAGPYGPYAHNLNKVLEVLDGHFMTGYGDTQKPDVEIELLPGSVREADEFIIAHKNSINRLNKVADLIEGFQTPYGIELLSSVHWLVHHGDSRARDVTDAISLIKKWTDRKRRMFHPDHIQIAWKQLSDKMWLSEMGSR